MALIYNLTWWKKLGKKTIELSQEAVEALHADIMRLSMLKNKIKQDIHDLVLERETLRDGLPSNPVLQADTKWTIWCKSTKPTINQLNRYASEHIQITVS